MTVARDAPPGASITSPARTLPGAVVALVFAVDCAATGARAATIMHDRSSAGVVRFVKSGTTGFDRYTRNPTATQQRWMRAHYWRMRVYTPYFDSRLSWFPQAWVYKDLYAIYTGSALADAHPEWILRDGDGNALYIPWGCADRRCPQFAGDIGHPAFRAHWIETARAVLARGYVGLFVDDVNMDLSRVSDVTTAAVVPIDPRTGAPMTNADWRRYMAEFTEEIRRAFPDREIVHNALWFFGHDNPFVQRQLRSADYIELERGVNDAGLVGGIGRFGFERLLQHIDWLHEQGKGVVFDAGAKTNAAREYGLAAFFLVSSGRDALGNDPGGTPDDWWRGYDVGLGAALGPRYAWRDVLRRDFEHGTVLLNPPGARKRKVQLDRSAVTIGCRRITTVRLRAAEGTVLRTGLTPKRCEAAATAMK